MSSSATARCLLARWLSTAVCLATTALGQSSPPSLPSPPGPPYPARPALTFHYFSSQVSASAHQTIRGRRGRADLQEDQRPPGTVRLRRHRELHRSRSQPASGGHQCTSSQGSGEARRGGGESQVRLMFSGDESEGPLAEDLSAG